MKVAIAGFGQEGKASYAYWNTPGNEVVVVDERDAIDGLPESTSTILGADSFAQLSDFDLIIRSPSVNPKKLPYDEKVWSATNEFFEKCPAPIIGVTGTKGKGTTCSLIASILQAAGKTVHLVGNIGVPALNELVKIQPDDIVVYELSSFQLWDTKKSPHTAVVLMIEPDHLDIHDSFEDYIQAKTNIVLFQSDKDSVIFNNSDTWSRAIVEQSHATKFGYPFDLGELATAIALPGKHNKDNACAAILAVQEYVKDAATLREGLAAFSGLPHRLKFIREVNNVSFYDDSIATTPGSAIAAVRAFEQPKVLILGGHTKGADYHELIQVCKTTDTKVLAIGKNGDEIAELCEEIGVTCVRESGAMSAIVAKANEIAQAREVVILSPAAASFDMFKSYADRGDQFVAAVQTL